MASKPKRTTQKKKAEGSANPKLIGDGLDSLKRKGAPPALKKLLIYHGGEVITRLGLKREPLKGAVKYTLDWMSSGKLDQKARELKYDNITHDSLAVQLSDNSMWRLEKDEVVKCKELKVWDATYDIPIPANKRVTLKQMFNNAYKVKGPLLWNYHAQSDNCQEFTRAMIDESGFRDGLSPELLKKIEPQDADALLSTIPGIIRPGIHFVTDLGGVADHVIHGNNVTLDESIGLPRNTQEMKEVAKNLLEAGKKASFDPKDIEAEEKAAAAKAFVDAQAPISGGDWREYDTRKREPGLYYAASDGKLRKVIEGSGLKDMIKKHEDDAKVRGVALAKNAEEFFDSDYYFYLDQRHKDFAKNMVNSRLYRWAGPDKENYLISNGGLGGINLNGKLMSEGEAFFSNVKGAFSSLADIAPGIIQAAAGDPSGLGDSVKGIVKVSSDGIPLDATTGDAANGIKKTVEAGDKYYESTAPKDEVKGSGLGVKNVGKSPFPPGVRAKGGDADEAQRYAGEKHRYALIQFPKKAYPTWKYLGDHEIQWYRESGQLRDVSDTKPIV